MGDRLKGKVAVVTGSGQGIGRATAVEMAREGAKLITNNRKPGTEGGDAQTTSDEITSMGGEAVPVFADVSDPADAKGIIQAAVDTFGRIDILCNIAGIDRPKMMWNMSEEEWDHVLGVHLKGTFNLTRHAAPLMKEQRYGRIINCGSEAYQGDTGHINYTAAKGGIVGLSRGIARELGTFGVTCNVFIPRASTRMVQGEEIIEGIQKRVGAGLISKEKADEMAEDTMPPEYFTSFLAFLASQEAGYINGQVFLTTPGALGLFSQPAIVIQAQYEEGPWTFEQCAHIVKDRLMVNRFNPAPKQAE